VALAQSSLLGGAMIIAETSVSIGFALINPVKRKKNTKTLSAVFLFIIYF
jgi:hypothetical protein